MSEGSQWQQTGERFEAQVICIPEPAVPSLANTTPVVKFLNSHTTQVGPYCTDCSSFFDRHASGTTCLFGSPKTPRTLAPPCQPFFRGTVIVGSEYLLPTLGQAVFPFAGFTHDKVKKALLQRVREFKPDATEAEVLAALHACPLIPGVKEYYIVPAGGAVLALEKSAAAAAGFDTAAQPEAEEVTLAEESGPPQIPNFVVNPVTVTSTTLLGFGSPTPLPSSAVLTDKHKRKAGIGFNGCLGELTVEHVTKAYINGFWAGVL